VSENLRNSVVVGLKFNNAVEIGVLMKNEQEDKCGTGNNNNIDNSGDNIHISENGMDNATRVKVNMSAR
jgi:hypothetical protein